MPFIIAIVFIVFIIIVLLSNKQSNNKKKTLTSSRPQNQPSINRQISQRKEYRDLVDAEDLRFKADSYQSRINEELRTSKSKILDAQRKGYIKANTAWTNRLQEFNDVSTSLYRNLQYENSKKLSVAKFRRYTSLHFRCVLLGNLAYEDYMKSKAVREEIKNLLIDYKKRKVRLSKKEAEEMYKLKNDCITTTKFLFDRMVQIQNQAGILRDKIRDECGERGKEWYKKNRENRH